MTKALNFLIIVDMQNDFLTGSLANTAAVNIIPPMCAYIKENAARFNSVFLTYDRHYYNYLGTTEGKHLPIEHCLFGTSGMQYPDALIEALADVPYRKIFKEAFGYDSWDEEAARQYEKYFTFFNAKNAYNYFEEYPPVFTLVGTCTDICVISNALAIKTAIPSAEVRVVADLCAGTSAANHEAALAVMRACNIDVIEWRKNFVTEGEISE